MMQCAVDGKHTAHERWMGDVGAPVAIVYELQLVGPQRTVPLGLKVHRCTYCGALFTAHHKAEANTP